MPWKLFVAEPTDLARKSFRRYVSGSTCAVHPHRYHNAEVVVAPEVPIVVEPPVGKPPDEDDKADPRWPRTCVCGHPFAPEDDWQVNVDLLYTGSPDGKLYTIRELPVGAMWNAWWFADDPAARERYAGPDGKAWCIMMPCRVEWIVYGPSSNGSKWQVTGTPPLITVSPSIGINIGPGMIGHAQSYHGFIGINGAPPGVMTEDVDGRKFEGLLRTA